MKALIYIERYYEFLQPCEVALKNEMPLMLPFYHHLSYTKKVISNDLIFFCTLCLTKTWVHGLESHDHIRQGKMYCIIQEC